jgi:hypothetical protein
VGDGDGVDVAVRVGLQCAAAGRGDERHKFRVAKYLQAVEKPGNIEMHVLPQHEIFAIANEAECVPLEVAEDDSIGVPAWISNVFTFRKSDEPVGKDIRPLSGRGGDERVRVAKGFAPVWLTGSETPPTLATRNRRKSRSNSFTFVKDRPYLTLYCDLAETISPCSILELGIFEGP